MLAPRKFGVVYSVIDRGDSLLVLTNKDDQKNFALLAAPAALDMATAPSAPPLSALFKPRRWVEESALPFVAADLRSSAAVVGKSARMGDERSFCCGDEGPSVAAAEAGRR